MIRVLLIAGALVTLVALLSRLLPVSGQSAIDAGTGGQPAGEYAALGSELTTTDHATVSKLPPAAVPDRDVTPSGFTRGQRTGETFTRLPPRPPLSTPPVKADEEPRATRQILLPRPVVVDAAHLKIGDGTIVLSGIASIPVDRTCGTDASAWPCGMRARTALRGYVRSRSVRCEVPEDFGEERETIESACTLRGDDVGAWIVRNGWAEAMPGGPYEAAEAEARQKRRGIWR